MEKQRAVFFDRDGVVNVSPGPGYVLAWEGFHFQPGVGAVLRWLKDRGWKLVLVTNQQGVAKGEMTRGELDAIHAKMQQELGPAAAFDRIEVCDHLAGECTCRKPAPGMALSAAAGLNLDLAQCWLVGDNDSDIQMARNAGIPTTVRFAGEKPAGEPAEHAVCSHAELLELLRREMGDI